MGLNQSFNNSTLNKSRPLHSKNVYHIMQPGQLATRTTDAANTASSIGSSNPRTDTDINVSAASTLSRAGANTLTSMSASTKKLQEVAINCKCCHLHQHHHHHHHCQHHHSHHHSQHHSHHHSHHLHNHLHNHLQHHQHHQQEQHCNTQRLVASSTAYSKSNLDPYPWFHRQLSRQQATEAVLKDGNEGHGLYLVRLSDTRPGEYVLTFNAHGLAKHLRMSITSDDQCKQRLRRAALTYGATNLRQDLNSNTTNKSADSPLADDEDNDWMWSSMKLRNYVDNCCSCCCCFGCCNSNNNDNSYNNEAKTTLSAHEEHGDALFGSCLSLKRDTPSYRSDAYHIDSPTCPRKEKPLPEGELTPEDKD